MPDADAVADFTVLGRDLKFTGVGYHDKVSMSETSVKASSNTH